MQYVILLINTALALWLIFNLYQAIVAFLGWRKEADPEPFLSFLLERIGFLGRTFVSTVVYAILAAGIAYILYEIGAMIFT
jgi:hypothetical protein